MKAELVTYVVDTYEDRCSGGSRPLRIPRSGIVLTRGATDTSPELEQGAPTMLFLRTPEVGEGQWFFIARHLANGEFRFTPSIWQADDLPMKGWQVVRELDNWEFPIGLRKSLFEIASRWKDHEQAKALCAQLLKG